MLAVYSGMRAPFSGLVPVDSCLNELRVLQPEQFLYHISVLIAPALLDYHQSTNTQDTRINEAVS